VTTVSRWDERAIACELAAGGAAVASMQCVKQPATQGKPAWAPGWDGPAGACAQRAASNGAAAATDSGNSKACKATA